MVDDAGNRGNNEKTVTEKRNADGDTDGLEATPSCVGDVCSKKRNDVDPGSAVS